MNGEPMSELVWQHVYPSGARRQLFIEPTGEISFIRRESPSDLQGVYFSPQMWAEMVEATRVVWEPLLKRKEKQS